MNNRRYKRERERLWPPIVTVPVDFIKIGSCQASGSLLTHFRKRPTKKLSLSLTKGNNREIITNSHIKQALLLMNFLRNPRIIRARNANGEKRFNRSTNWAIIPASSVDDWRSFVWLLSIHEAFAVSTARF